MARMTPGVPVMPFEHGAPGKVTVHLHGGLGQEFGEEFELYVRSPAEAFRLLEANFPGRFFKYVRQHAYHVTRGNGDWDDGADLSSDVDLLRLGLGGDDLHIVPAVVGASSKGKGWFGIIIGVILIGAALVLSGGTLAAPLTVGGTSILGLTWGSVAAVGAVLAIGGAMQLLSPTQQTPQAGQSNQNTLFSGPINTTQPGGVVPVIYGRCITGSVVASGGIFLGSLVPSGTNGYLLP